MKEREDSWQVVTKSQKPKKPSISGTNRDGGLKGVPLRSRDFWQFSVTRLEATTTDDAVRRHLHNAGIEVKEVWMLGSKIKGTKTAKIRVAKEHRERAKSAALWPVHCQIRDWEFGPRESKVKSRAE